MLAATAMAAQGELNVGQLARQRYGADAFLVGFTTYAGHVTAASNWGGRPRRKHVRPALAESHEAVLHQALIPNFWLATSDCAVRRALQRCRASSVRSV